MNRLALVALLGVIACGPGNRDGDMRGSADGGADDGDAAVGPDAMEACFDQTTTVDVEAQIQIEESCAIWNSLDELAGTATITRSGSTLTIDFENGVVFTGTVDASGAVSLTYAHDHTFTDNCGWRATETLVGQLDLASCDLTLDYDYVETVVIDNGGCASPCGAQADVTLDLTPIIL
jgi:hypothetical protein